MDCIRIDGLRELGIHGVLPEEQTRPQPFEIDVELHVDLTTASESDKLDDTVDYGAVCEAISRVVSSERYALLERLAGGLAGGRAGSRPGARVAEVGAAEPGVHRVHDPGHKLPPPVRAMVDHVAVSIHRDVPGR